MLSSEYSGLLANSELLRPYLPVPGREETPIPGNVKLSEDILIQVFHTLRDLHILDAEHLSWDEDKYAYSWLYVRAVCRLWDEVVTEHKSFWTFFSYKYSVGFREMIMRRSKPVPIYLFVGVTREEKINIRAPWGGKEKCPTHKTLRLALWDREIADRVQDLVITDSSRESSWTEIMDVSCLTSLPRLKNLTFQNSGDFAAEFTGDLKAPLESLTLLRSSIRWDSSIYHGLSSLSVKSARTYPTLYQLLAVLKRCPRLSHLELDTFGPGPEGDKTDSEKIQKLGVVGLPYLRTLGLTCDERERLYRATTFVPYLDLPASLEWTIRMKPHPKATYRAISEGKLIALRHLSTTLEVISRSVSTIIESQMAKIETVTVLNDFDGEARQRGKLIWELDGNPNYFLSGDSEKDKRASTIECLVSIVLEVGWQSISGTPARDEMRSTRPNSSADLPWSVAIQ